MKKMRWWSPSFKAIHKDAEVSTKVCWNVYGGFEDINLSPLGICAKTIPFPYDSHVLRNEVSLSFPTILLYDSSLATARLHSMHLSNENTRPGYASTASGVIS